VRISTPRLNPASTDQIALVEIFPPAQPSPSHAARSRMWAKERLPHAAFQRLQPFTRVIPFVRAPPRSAPTRGCARLLRGRRKHRRVAFVGPDGSARPRRRPRSTACSGLKARSVVPFFIVATLASGSFGLFQSAFDSVLPWRLRSKRARSSALGVSMSLYCAIRVSIAR
jgi:hypothetical protein